MVCATVPTHIAVIMDGNGRWATARGLPRSAGHQAGVDATRRLVEACVQRGVQVLTIFAFSSENWHRPETEVKLLMDLFLRTLRREITRLHENGVRVRFVGDRERFSNALQERIAWAEDLTADNAGMLLMIAVNYGGRWDLTQAARRLAEDAVEGHIKVDTIDEEAFADPVLRNPHAVALATVDPDGAPSVRMVLCNAIDAERGTFTMYTNRESRKGRALAHEPRAAIVFHWPDRQARIEGTMELVPDDVSDVYFASRPLDSRLGAWASAQSEPVASRAALLRAVEDVAARFGARAEGDVVPRPPFWGGYTLVASSVELWASRRGRVHDRAVWRREAPGTPWRAQRLQP